MSEVLRELTAVLEQRKTAPADKSYVASLHKAGLNKILEKVGEECVETIVAAKDCQQNQDPSALISETADLWFHCMVLLSHLDTDVGAVLAELENRFNLSGLEEKASRNAQPETS